MKPSREQYLKILNAGQKCQQVFVKRSLSNLEPAIDALLRVHEDCTNDYPLINYLIVNIYDKKFDYLTNLIIKQIATTALVASEFNYQSSAKRSYTKACLIKLYALTPAIIKSKKNPSDKRELQVKLGTVKLNAYAIAKKIQLADQDCLKLLSLIARKNRYFNTNQLGQSLVLFSLNSNLRANLGVYTPAESFFKALSHQFTHFVSGQLANQSLPAFTFDFYQVISDKFLAGSAITTKHNKKFILIRHAAPGSAKNAKSTAGSQKKLWLCMPLMVSSKRELEVVFEHDIHSLIPQPQIDLANLIGKFDCLSDKHKEDINFINTNKKQDDTSALKYQPAPQWKQLTQTLQLEDTPKLINTISNTDEFADYKQTILDYATSINREQLKITDLKHAVNLLGTGRLLPIVIIAAMKAQQASFNYNGSSIVKNKIDLFSEIAQELAKSNHRDIPEYLGSVARLIFLGLITIPKACFAAASEKANDNLTVQQGLSLANIYNIKDIATWKKITCQLAKLWYLPKHQQSLILTYFEQLEKKLSRTKSSSVSAAQKARNQKHESELKLLDQTTYIFTEITELGQINPDDIDAKTPEKDNSIDALLLAEQEAGLTYPHISNNHLYTPLS